MKKLLIALLFLIPSISSAQISNYVGLTAAQLSGITSGVTNIASKSYWTTNAYAQIAALMEFVSANSVAFTANDATPDLTDASLYYTANTSTTAITDLTYTTGYTSARKFVIIIIEDAYTSITHGASTIDCGGVNLNCSDGDVLLFVRDHSNTVWRCKLLFLASS